MTVRNEHRYTLGVNIVFLERDSMNLKDKQYKSFFHANERFADVVNGSLFEGKQMLKANELSEMDTEFNEGNRGEHVIQRRRDLLKKHKGKDSDALIVGIELQSSIDKDMIMRMMEYDAMTYLHQKERPLIPVLSVVLYCGERKWSHAQTLYEQMNLPEWMKDYVSDYRFHFVELLKVNVDNFKNEEVREFVELFQDVHFLNREQFLVKYSNKGLKSVEAVQAVAILGKCKELERIIIEDEEGHIMCKNFDRIVSEIRMEGLNEGRAEGILEGKAAGMLEGKAVGMLEGKAVGMVEGETRGIEKERLKTIERLCLINAGVDVIACACGLSKEDVLKVISEQKMRYGLIA